MPQDAKVPEPIMVQRQLGAIELIVSQDQRGNYADITLRGIDGESVIISSDDWTKLKTAVENALDYIYNQ